MQRRIEISEDLWLRVERSSRYQGFSSPDLYVADVLEKALAQAAATVSDQEVTRKMEELGYLDFGRDI